MGYGQMHNVVKEIATPLWARAMVLRCGDTEITWVHLEQCLVSMAIRSEMLQRLKLVEGQLIITAQHTHSAPGGYSHYPFYNFTIPGFQIKVFEKICSAIEEAVHDARKSLTDVTLSWGVHAIAADKEVAFNRSMPSYLANNDVSKLKINETNLAIDREMEGLMFFNKEGKALAILNWFGVHCTSVSSFNQRIHHDNKGVAADLYEKNHPGTLAFFLQSAAGDVSPNFIWDKDLKRNRGKFKDQYESTAFNGEIQFREAEKISYSQPVQPFIRSEHRYFDLAKSAAPAAHGVAFFQGTKEGPGINSSLARVMKMISRRVRKSNIARHPEERSFYEAHDPKDILLDHRTGTFLGIPLQVWKKLPPLPEPTVNAFRQVARKGAINTLPWTPAILPFQILRIGQLLIALVPGEITTVSARRLKQELMAEHSHDGITKIIISSYANGHMGYITTPEEYRTQSYEAGHTVYGIGTLSAIQLGFKGLFSPQKSMEEQLEPFQFPEEELKLRSIL